MLQVEAQHRPRARDKRESEDCGGWKKISLNVKAKAERSAETEETGLASAVALSQAFASLLKDSPRQLQVASQV